MTVAVDDPAEVRRVSSAARLLSTYGSLIGIGVLAALLLVWAPSSLSDFRLGNLGKYCALALGSMGIGLAWGRGGMLVLGQGVFFGLGAYAMAMHMKLEAAGPEGVPDFMSLYGDGTMPFWWEPFRSATFTVLAIVALPAVVSFVLGYAILKRRVKGAYFAILTQAMSVAFATLLIATIKQTGGFNGLNTFSTVFGHNLFDPTVKRNLYLVAAGLLIVFLLILWQVYRSRYGELLVATRDAEERIRFLGYDPANIKLVAFVVAAVMASIGGAVFVPIAGIVSPSNVDAAASIMLLAGVALGGRASLFGPALGAIAVGYGRSTLSERFPTQWTYFLGALFIVVILFLPGGVASLWPTLRSRWTPVACNERIEDRPRSRPCRPRPGRAGGVGMTASFLAEDYLEIRDLTVDFDGFKAVDGVDLTFLQGRLHFLIGPNGAGKTTLVDALTGLVRSTGQATFRNHDLLAMKSHMIVRLGIGRTFQTASVFEQLSVLQNLDIAAGVHRKARGSILARRKVPERVDEALETIGLTELAHRPAGILAHGQKQWLEVGMLLVQDAKVMFLDETVAGMSGDEREETGELLKRIVGDRTIVIIEHDMDFMRRYADFVTVMHTGAVLAEGTVAEVQADQRVQEVYLGTATEGAAHG